MAPASTSMVSTRFTPAEYVRLERAAGERPVALWLHDLALAHLKFDARLAVPLAEHIALRKIVTTALFKLCRGERITPDQMQQIVDRADEDKLKLAVQRLADLQEVEP